MSLSQSQRPDTVGQHYQVGKKIGTGSMSVVFEGTDLLNNQKVAIKFESNESNARKLRDEWRMYRMLATSPGIPQAYYFEAEGPHKALVMDLLGPSLDQLFNLCGRRFSLKTVCLVAPQMITRIQTVHEKNLVYRGVRLDEFLIGLPGACIPNVIHMIDFGLAKVWRDSKTKQHIPYREGKSPTGVARYMSINTHLGREQSRRDDLESLGHLFIYLLRGDLPWQGIKGATYKEKNENIGEKKQMIAVTELCAGLPNETVIYMNYVRNLGFEETPDYNFLRGLFSKMLKDAGEVDDGVMDWMLPNRGKSREASLDSQTCSQPHIEAEADTQATIEPSLVTPDTSSISSIHSQFTVVDATDGKVDFDDDVNPPWDDLEGDEENPGENNLSMPIIRDPRYYFEDGNVALRVRSVLFKVHASLLRAHSEDLFNRLNPSSQLDKSTIDRVARNEDNLIIRDIQPSQFRNLMKVIYCLPSNNIILTRPSANDKQAVVGDFDCYLDVAILSRKFSMEVMQQWARKKLNKVFHKSGKVLAEEFDDFYEYIMPDEDNRLGDEDLRTQTMDCVPAATSYPAFRLMEAIHYAKAVSDNALFYDVLGVLEYYCTNPGHKIELLLSFFRIADLRITNPSLFGFLFLLILSRGKLIWVEKAFTREDRTVLFSVQSFLVPLPAPIKVSIGVPLFTRPTHANEIVTILSDNTGCKGRCSQEIFLHWEKTFPAGYYHDVNSKEFSVSIKALTTLPLRRFDFATRLGEVKCKQCSRRIQEQLDHDMQEVFARLAKYYNVCD